MGSDTAARVYAVIAITVIVVGLCCLAPHLQAETFTPVLLQPGRAGTTDVSLRVTVTGDVDHPGIYTVDSTTGLVELLALAGARSASPSVRLDVPPDSGPGTPSAQKVDINHAEVWLLEALPGIGPDRARAIVDFRLEHGDFTRVEELLLVPGIGSAVYEDVKDCITVTG